MWHFSSPEIVFGEDALERLDTLGGRRAYVVTDPGVARLGFLDRVCTRLQAAGMATGHFAEVEAEPAVQTVQRGAQQMLAFGPDWIIGLGGGSAMDAALAMWILYERPDLALEQVNPFESIGLRTKARLCCIPTTAGTGSEVTPAAILTDTVEHRKVEVALLEALPDLAIVDPQFSAQMPAQLTADTGIDALTHAVEGYSGSWANDFSDGLCLQATHLIFEYLPRAVTQGAGDREAREKMANAAAMAGLGMGNSHIALAHAMGHSAGALLGLPHGRATGICLPYTVEYTGNGGTGRYLGLARLLGLCTEESAAAPRLAAAIRELMRAVGQPVSFEQAGIARATFEANLVGLLDRAETDASMITSRRLPDRAELERLFRCTYEGRDVDF